MDAQPTTGPAQHILYVDDDEALIRLIERVFEKRGVKVTGFINPARAIDAVRANPQAFDLVLSDYKMPGMTGFAVASQLRQIRQNLPIALFTANPNEAAQQWGDTSKMPLILSKDTCATVVCSKIQKLILSRTY